MHTLYHLKALAQLNQTQFPPLLYPDVFGVTDVNSREVGNHDGEMYRVGWMHLGEGRMRCGRCEKEVRCEDMWGSYRANITTSISTPHTDEPH